MLHGMTSLLLVRVLLRSDISKAAAQQELGLPVAEPWRSCIATMHVAHHLALQH